MDDIYIVCYDFHGHWTSFLGAKMVDIGYYNIESKEINIYDKTGETLFKGKKKLEKLLNNESKL